MSGVFPWSPVSRSLKGAVYLSLLMAQAEILNTLGALEAGSDIFAVGFVATFVWIFLPHIAYVSREVLEYVRTSGGVAE